MSGDAPLPCLDTISTCDAPGGRPAAYLAVAGERLVSVSADGLLATWNGSAVERSLPGGDGPIDGLSAGDGLALLVRGRNKIMVRSLDDGAPRARWSTAHAADVVVDCAVEGPDRVVAAIEEHWGHPTDRVARLLEYRVSAPQQPPRVLAQAQGVLPPWSLAAIYEPVHPGHERVRFDGGRRERLVLPPGQLVSVDVPDGWLLLRAYDGTLTVRGPDGTCTTLRVGQLAYGPMRLTPDARHLLTWDPTGTVALFDVATGAECGRWERGRRELDAVRAVVPCRGDFAVLEKEGGVRWLRGPRAG